MEIKDTILELHSNSKFEKNKHFNAADRKKTHTYWLGVPVIIITVLLGSALFTQHLEDDIGKIAGSILAFISALLVSLQTFTNPKDAEEGHRSVGNRYIAVSRKCTFLIAKFEEGLLDLNRASEEYEKLLEEYLAINREAESFPTSKRDFNHANEMASTKIT